MPEEPYFMWITPARDLSLTASWFYFTPGIVSLVWILLGIQLNCDAADFSCLCSTHQLVKAAIAFMKMLPTLLRSSNRNNLGIIAGRRYRSRGRPYLTNQLAISLFRCAVLAQRLILLLISSPCGYFSYFDAGICLCGNRYMYSTTTAEDIYSTTFST